MADGGAGARGRFITFEGGEGAGKSEQVRRLAGALEGHGIAVSVTREPGGSPGAENIRELLVTGEAGRWDAMSEALLLYAARRDHWLRVVEPALERGTWVISDRFADSTLVYQGYCGGVPLNDLRRLHALALGDVTPCLTVLLDLPAETGLARSLARDSATGATERRFERMPVEFHRRIREGFKSLAAAESDRFVVLDAGRDIDKVAAAVFAAVRDRLGRDLGL